MQATSVLKADSTLSLLTLNVNNMSIISVLPKNTTQCPRPGLEPGPLNQESSSLTLRPPGLPQNINSCLQNNFLKAQLLQVGEKSTVTCVLFSKIGEGGYLCYCAVLSFYVQRFKYFLQKFKSTYLSSNLLNLVNNLCLTTGRKMIRLFLKVYQL